MQDSTFFYNQDGHYDKTIAENYGVHYMHLSLVLINKINKLNLVKDSMPNAVIIQADLDTLNEKLDVCQQGDQVLIEFSQSSEDKNIYKFGSKIPVQFNKKGEVENKVEINLEIEQQLKQQPSSSLNQEATTHLGNFFQLTHTVLIVINNKKKEIFYKDPYGKEIKREISDIFKAQSFFKDYQIVSDSTKQQHPLDRINCRFFTFKNLQSLYNKEPFIDIPKEMYLQKMNNMRQEIVSLIESKIQVGSEKTFWKP